MQRMRVGAGRAIAAALISAAAACAGGAHAPTTTTAGGSGTAAGSGGSGATAADCAAVRDPVTALYTAEAQASGQGAHDPTFVADNVAMVMTDCAKDPARVAPCAAHATGVAQLEHECLIPLDGAGTEGEVTP